MRQQIGSTYRAITLRLSNVGGGFRSVAGRSPEGLFYEADNLILLIHGYAVHKLAAEASYDTFVANLDPAWRAMAAPVYWPGDSNSMGPGYATTHWIHWARTKASYSFQPKRAGLGADRLAAAITDGLKARRLRNRRRRLNLHIVAHSMGCRLILDMLQKFWAGPGGGPEFAILLTALMAPAVPAYMIGEQGDLREGLIRTGKVRVYHSPDDGVLGWFFKPGQLFERTFGRGGREAIGLGGVPRDPAFLNVTNVPSAPNGHGDYWPSVRVAKDLNRVMREIHPKIDRPGMAVARTAVAWAQPSREIAGRRPSWLVPAPREGRVVRERRVA